VQKARGNRSNAITDILPVGTGSEHGSTFTISVSICALKLKCNICVSFWNCSKDLLYVYFVPLQLLDIKFVLFTSGRQIKQNLYYMKLLYIIFIAPLC